MKSLLYTSLLVFLFSWVYDCTAQQQDTVYFDPASGNYIIEYTGYFPYARGADGVLRPLTPDDTLQEGEEYIEKDSMLTVVFEPATKIDPKVKSTVSKDSRTNTYLYSYSIENGVGSQQNLLSFILEFGNVEVINKTEADSWHNRRQMERSGDQMVFANRWAWHGDQGLEATWSTDGFALESPGIPGIMNANFRGRASLSILWPGGLPSPELRQKLSAIRKYPANHVLRKTIAPVAPPTQFEATAFLDTLISYKHEAFARGWIDNQGIVNSLDAKLDNVKKHLEKQKTKQAINVLNAFINQVEAQNGKHLTSEAYALLKFNAKFLIEQLSQP